MKRFKYEVVRHDGTNSIENVLNEHGQGGWRLHQMLQLPSLADPGAAPILGYIFEKEEKD